MTKHKRREKMHLSAFAFILAGCQLFLRDRHMDGIMGSRLDRKICRLLFFESYELVLGYTLGVTEQPTPGLRQFHI